MIASEAQVTINVRGQHVEFMGDKPRLVQALTNLVGNALKFSPPGTLVEISSHLEGEAIEFQVVDQGRGVPAGQRELIFERFQQVDASDTRDFGGTGLGLAITKAIIERHNGRIWVESESGMGSTFKFVLPLR
jgi:signal transduction histidine kinase